MVRYTTIYDKLQLWYAKVEHWYLPHLFTCMKESGRTWTVRFWVCTRWMYQYLCRTVAVYKALQLSCMFCITAAIKCLISHENFVVDCSTVPYHSSRTLPSSFHMDRTFCWILGPGPQLARSSLSQILPSGKRLTSRFTKTGHEGNGFGPRWEHAYLP